MAENYPQFLSSMMAIGEAHAEMSPEEINNPFLAAPHLPANKAPVSYQNFGHFSGLPGPSFSFQQPVSKSRRKSATSATSDVEQVKHRRTRSGCFTCRGRRVKCDEAHPICERCRKGSRDCVYPDPSTSKGSSRHRETASNSTSNQSPGSSNSEYAENDDTKPSAPLEIIPDEGEAEDREEKILPTRPLKNKLVLQISDNIPRDNSSVSSSPSTAISGEQSFWAGQAPDFRSNVTEDLNLRHLPSDYQMHLQYFYENITNHHYCLTNDTDNFFVRGIIIEASRNKLLLNTVVAFSAYMRSIQHADGKLGDFLLYYNRSITLLLGCLKQEATNNLPTLLSILQLATIEEYLGDWLNLMGHQRAALELFTKLFTPQTVMETRIGQICLCWYARFDVGGAFLGMARPTLSRDWFTNTAVYYRDKINQEPNEILWRAEERLARLHIIRHDMALLVSNSADGDLSESEFFHEHRRITTQLMTWRDTWDPMLTLPRYLVRDYPWQRPPDPDDIIDPYERGLLYNPPLLSSTMVLVEWHTLVVLHKSTTRVARAEVARDLRHHSYSVCQLFEAMEYWPSKPKGALLGFRLSLTLVALFLPRDERHRAWLWRKFAVLETMGSIQALPLRSRLAELFNDKDAAQWWLPDNRGFSPMLQSIRNFADERHHAAVHALDRLQVAVKLFDKLNVTPNTEE